MTVDEITRNTGANPAPCCVVILHETDETLAHAKYLCERIMADMWTELDIDVQQWPMAVLSEQTQAAKAASVAAHASVVVVAAEGEGEFSQDFMEWTERLAAMRHHHEGALVGLFVPVVAKEGAACSRDAKLHQVALRAGMDYLNHFPESPARGIPDLMEWCASRAGTFTSTLDDIIRTDPRP
jgi:hypothetical protein